MAESVLVFNKTNTAADTIELFYQAGTGISGVLITSFTAANDTETSHSYKAYIYSASGDTVKAVVPQKIVVKDTADYGASIVNHLIPAGGSLRIESSTADSLSFYVTGNIR